MQTTNNGGKHPLLRTIHSQDAHLGLVSVDYGGQLLIAYLAEAPL